MENVSIEHFTLDASCKDMQTSSEIVQNEENLAVTCKQHCLESSQRFKEVFLEEGAGEAILESSGKKEYDDKQKGILNNSMQENSDDFWFCAICHDRIMLEEIAQIKGCEHAYCVTCILRWASYKADCWCPQCKLPFSFLFVYKSLDGSVHDYMSEESVCLLLRAAWFKPVPIEFKEVVEENDDWQYEDDIYEERYYTSNLRLGNRRWGDNGYVRAGRKEARPVGVSQVHSPEDDMGSSSTRPKKGKEISKDVTGRRAKRALKREAADKAAAARHQQHLHRLGRN
ncbi:uncharacterized protein LOC131072436 [Cryptomeria japonica]|uniref:uncharacterized protein LOC131072436 n=1 Tax=Cryptomeria japonica TaxID=3369 RepID=UPI0027DA2D82|nr:uncharacterized protein LOC131072436 [Cryptomeria japonica]XP_057864575.2 uncharacterized protein LOC131072436 [Cryptomeria japonica]XP_057864576.2 uncharacterized protein LOC131072436 [Cryptomeria japonica]